VLGLGSTIVPPGDNSLAAFMDSLRLLQGEEIELIAPGHGPWITDPAAKLAEYVEHRQMREHRLLAALERGERSRAALLAEAWDDIPIELLPMAAMAMEAHLEKLEGEGRLPEGLDP
jgi:glyoxylase-like metal-dependent hydrolase (beta-lactamase superfamily II)